MPHRVLAILAWRAGDYGGASAHATRAAALIRDQGDRYVQAASIRQLAAIIGAGDGPLAAELLGVADGLVPGVRVIARDELADSRLRADLAARLGEDEVAALVARGRSHDTRALYATVDRALRQMGSGPQR
jgi:hypothetical protein